MILPSGFTAAKAGSSGQRKPAQREKNHDRTHHHLPQLQNRNQTHRVAGCTAAVFEIYDDEDEAREALTSISEELWQNLQINLTEWLLAEGDILVKGETQRVAELLLGPRGPLRLYDVTDVVTGVGVTGCDAFDIDQSPRWWWMNARAASPCTRACRLARA